MHLKSLINPNLPTMNIDRLIAIIAFVVIIIMGNLYMNQKSSNQSKSSIIAEKNAEIKAVKLNNNQLAYEKKRAIANAETIKEGYAFLEDSLKALDIKLKEVESALFVVTTSETKGSGEIDTVYIDSLQTVAGNLRVSKPFFLFDGYLYQDGSFSYTSVVRDSLALVNTVTRKSIFSKWQYNTRVVSANPDLVVTGITSITVKEKGNNFTIGITAGYGIGSGGLTPFVGIGITKPIIKF